MDGVPFSLDFEAEVDLVLRPDITETRIEQIERLL